MTQSERDEGIKIVITTQCPWCHEYTNNNEYSIREHAKVCPFFNVLIDGLRDEMRKALKETTDD